MSPLSFRSSDEPNDVWQQIPLAVTSQQEVEHITHQPNSQDFKQRIGRSLA
ncbi:hypothetical protein LPH55_05205 [Xylella taiwanensis]|uniref:Uncharacterized protein n=1 Tax=Xylella taiwanensis TaxID=1444770 RepID=A0ABS8TVG0_9GAMM|nr:hypothetical protein [Xylella taiwanensis]MCD8472878.1 hypothetical protein [Xylella taiwanensis]